MNKLVLLTFATLLTFQSDCRLSAQLTIGAPTNTSDNKSFTPKSASTADPTASTAVSEREAILRRLELRYGISQDGGDGPLPVGGGTAAGGSAPSSEKPKELLDDIVNRGLLDDLLSLVDVRDTKPFKIVTVALRLLGRISPQEAATMESSSAEDEEYAKQFVNEIEKLKKQESDREAKFQQIEDDKQEAIDAAEEKAEKEKQKYELTMQVNELNRQLKEIQAELNKLK